MRLCSKTVSLFNARVDTSTRSKVYAKTLLQGVSWYGHDAAAVTNEGLKVADQTTVRVPYDTGYVPPSEYDGSGWTLQNGDIMALGDVAYTSDLKRLYGSACMTVLSVTDNRRAPHGRHFKVVGQ